MNSTASAPLSEQEQKLLLLLRKMGYGEVSLTVREGVPTEIKELRRSILLDR